MAFPSIQSIPHGALRGGLKNLFGPPRWDTRPWNVCLDYVFRVDEVPLGEMPKGTHSALQLA